MKGHMEKDGFHPHTQSKGVRKSRDQKEKTQGVKIRKRSDFTNDIAFRVEKDKTFGKREIFTEGFSTAVKTLEEENADRIVNQRTGEVLSKEDIETQRMELKKRDRKAIENLTNKDKQILRDWVKQNPNWTSIDDLPNKIFIPLVSSAGDNIDKRVEIQVEAIDFMKSVTPKSKKQMHERKAKETKLPKDVLKIIKEDFATQDVELDHFNPKWNLYEVNIDDGRFFLFPDEESAIAFGRQSIRDTASEYIPEKGNPQRDEYINLSDDELVEKIIDEQSDFGQRSELGAIAQSVAGYDGEFHELSNGWIGFQID